MNIDFTQMKTAEEKALEETRAEQEHINAEARQYLRDTDWYVVRYQETGVKIPEHVLSERQAARDRVKDLDND